MTTVIFPVIWSSYLALEFKGAWKGQAISSRIVSAQANCEARSNQAINTTALQTVIFFHISLMHTHSITILFAQRRKPKAHYDNNVS